MQMFCDTLEYAATVCIESLLVIGCPSIGGHHSIWRQPKSKMTAPINCIGVYMHGGIITRKQMLALKVHRTA